MDPLLDLLPLLILFLLLGGIGFVAYRWPGTRPVAGVLAERVVAAIRRRLPFLAPPVPQAFPSDDGRPADLPPATITHDGPPDDRTSGSGG